MPVINITECGGINQSLPHCRIKREDLTQLDNFIHSYTETNSSELVSFIQKSPSAATYMDDLGDVNGRGLYQFKSYSGATLYTLAAFSDGNIYKTGTTSYTQIHTGLTALNHIEFASYSRPESKDTVCIMTDGSANMLKWNPADAACTSVYNKDGESSTKLTGVLTFTKNKSTVTGSGTLFTTELQVGNWIRVGEFEKTYTGKIKKAWYFVIDTTEYSSKVATWYRVKAITNATELILENSYLGDTISGGSGNSQVKGGKITGTLTFTYNSTSVTAPSNLTSALTAGQWIRKDAKGKWYEIASLSHNGATPGVTTIVLRTTFKENTVAGTANMSESTALMPKFRFVVPYKTKSINKMIYLCNITDSEYGEWRHSEPDDPENVPSLNIDKLSGGKCITGGGQLGEYLVVFSEDSYEVYKYVPEKDDFMRIGSGNVGCISSKTIQSIPGGIVWASVEGLYKLTITEGLKKVSDKVKLELDGIVSGALNSTYYTAASGQNKMPQSAFDSEKGFYYLVYPLGLTKNSYLIMWDTLNDKWYRQTAIYANSMLIQRVSASSSRLIYTTANSDGLSYTVNSQSLINSVLTSGVLKFGLWSVPSEDGTISNTKWKSVTLRIMQSNNFDGSISLTATPDWSTSSITSVSSGTLTNAVANKETTIVFPVNQTAHSIQFALSDSMTAGGYGIIQISAEYEGSASGKYTT